jgi:UDP-GlcNAc3NAcA epimerase
MRKIATIIGARPQFIKASLVSEALADNGAEEILIDTGQHYDHEMAAIFYNELDLRPPTHQLAIGSGSHGVQTGRMIAAIEQVLVNEMPERVLVYGDTNSTLAGALAAAKLHIPVAHAEAGVRSFNRRMPEEINRVLTDHTSDRLFAPTEMAVQNLKNEGITDGVQNVGDVMYDVALRFAPIASHKSSVLDQLDVRKQNYLVATIHRAENTDDPMRFTAIMEAFQQIAKTIPIVFPVHPRTKRKLEEVMPEGSDSPICFVPPVGYLDMMKLVQNSKLVVTDSGGLQKEAFFHEIPCVTLRDETEWVELVDLGWNTVVSPTDSVSIANSIQSILASDTRQKPESSPYGDGKASEAIAQTLLKNS